MTFILCFYQSLFKGPVGSAAPRQPLASRVPAAPNVQTQRPARRHVVVRALDALCAEADKISGGVRALRQEEESREREISERKAEHAALLSEKA